jgi:hypothetical protein
MSCPDLGALRVSIDAADGPDPTRLREHVRACPSCADTLAELHRTAELAAPAIALTAPDRPPDDDAVAAALARLEQRRARLATVSKVPAQVPAQRSLEPEPLVDGAPTGRVASPERRRSRLSTAPTATTTAPAATTTAPAATTTAPGPDPVPGTAVAAGRRRGLRLGTRARAAVAAMAAALVLTGLVATPAGRAAASGFLAQFRSQRFEAVALDRTQATAVEDVVEELVQAGVFRGSAFAARAFGEPEPATDRADASRTAGFAVPVVDPAVLPGGIDPDPERILVSRAREVRLSFDRDQALEYLRRHGRPDAQLPERYDGTQLVVHLPAVVVQQFAGRDGGPALLVVKAGVLGLDAEGGASLDELREVVLGLPGLPAETVARLRAIGDWRNTLPLPVPTDEVRWRPTMVEGAEALGFADETGRLNALLWQRGGHIWGVAGVVDADEARPVATRLG